MFGSTRRCIPWLGVVILAMIASEAFAQGGQAKVITWNPPTSGEVYVGILGEILTPGVYRMDAQSLSLQAVIRRAGGLTDEASGTIRIVRQDRIVESVYFTPQSSNPLLSGDLLVVESARAQAAISRMYDVEPRDRPALSQAVEKELKATSGSGVQVAFVNVLDRPVVVKVKHENARLAQIVRMLDQPVEMAGDVRVIGPDRLISQSAAPLPVNASLSNGSVLVFPKNVINRRKLPTLPIPYDSEIATGAIPSLIGGASGQSAELRNVGQLPVMAQDLQGTQLAQPPVNISQPIIPLPPASSAVSEPPANERIEIPSNEAPLVSMPPRIATVPFLGQPRITTSTSQTTTSLGTDPVEPNKPVEPDSAKAKPGSQFDPADDLLDEEIQEPAPTKSGLSTGSLVGIAACMGLLIGIALLIRRNLEQRGGSANLDAEIEMALQRQAAISTELADEPELEMAEAAPQIPAQETPLPEPESSARSSSMIWLDQLLANELPIREEQPAFPKSMTLQGRIIPPPVLRVDGPSLPQGPHFKSQPESQLEERPGSPAAEGELEQVFDAFDAPHSARPAKPHFLRKAGQRAKAAAAESLIPRELSDTPVTDALRQLQGGYQ